MDIDMHYYGTYALARAAGLRADAARIIATAAEFVDDSTFEDVIVHPDGARFRGEGTAHHPSIPSLLPLNDRNNQQLVWVPFHFLPGAIGSTQSQRLICRKDSAVAKAMVSHHLGLADEAYALAMIGITAHVYADTFAHYGFSGVSSRVNRVLAPTLKPVNGGPLANPLMDRFFGKFGSQGGLVDNFRTKVASVIGQDTTGALGHGAVATFPDQPYLEWRYSYELAAHAGASNIERQNAKDYEDGAEALHGMFRTFAQRRRIFTDGAGRDFSAIRADVRAIFGNIVPTQDRIALWKNAMAAGKFSPRGEAIPDYDHMEWRQQTESLKDLPQPQDASGVPAYQFHHAAALHREYVLRTLLPQHGIYIM